MTLAPGQRIRNIRVERLLGAGGMSEVWRGWDDKLRRPVALKVVHAGRRLDPVARARFLREAQILSSLEHPGICKVYGLEEADGEDVLVMELVDGVPLHEVRGLDHGAKLAMGEAIATVLAVAHRHGIVHRDLKPQNVMRTPAGGVKVLDFDLAHRLGTDPAEDTFAEAPGVARSGDRSTATPDGALVGTVGYMSPEQATGDPLTTASDLYSLGIVLHELFTGRRAYVEVPSLEARLLRVSLADTLPVEGVEPALEELIEALEDLEPGRRPPAEAVARRLRELRGARGRARRLRWVAVAATAAALVVVGSVGVLVAPVVGRPRLGGVDRVVVLPVENRTGEASGDWVARGLTPMVAEALGAATGLAVVTGEATSDAPEETLVVAPGLERVGSGVELAAELRVGSRSAGSLRAPGASPVEAAAALAATLAPRLRPGATTNHPRALLTADPFTDQVFGRGLDARARGRLAEARDCFRLCLDRDPDFHRARLELARCALAGGEPAEAEALARGVAAAARDLGREDLSHGADGVLAAVAAARSPGLR